MCDVLLVASVDGPPTQFVPIPVPAVQSKAPLPFCHSQSGIDGTGPKSQKTSSTVTVGGGTVIVGYLTNVKLQIFLHDAQKPLRGRISLRGRMQRSGR